MERKTRAALVTTAMIVMLIHSDLQFPQVATSKDDIIIALSHNFSQFYAIEKKKRENVKESKQIQEAEHEARPLKLKEGAAPEFPRTFPYSLKEELELAQLVEAEAGTQGFYGKQLVADVVLNRVDSKIFPNTIHEVIFDPYQFSVIFDGRFDAMANRVSEESLKAARTEMIGPRLDYGILYFNSGAYCMNGSGGWKYKAHWFAY